MIVVRKPDRIDPTDHIICIYFQNVYVPEALFCKNKYINIRRLQMPIKRQNKCVKHISSIALISIQSMLQIQFLKFAV